MVKNGEHFYGEFGQEIGKFHNFFSDSSGTLKRFIFEMVKNGENGEHFMVNLVEKLANFTIFHHVLLPPLKPTKY